MGRAIASGTEVHVATGPAVPAPGEVWAFATAAGEVVVHRCRAVGPPHRFRGDARARDDEPVAEALLIGRVDRVRGARGERPVPTAALRDRARAQAGRVARITRSGTPRRAR